jgi:hypothetical protein
MEQGIRSCLVCGRRWRARTRWSSRLVLRLKRRFRRRGSSAAWVHRYGPNRYPSCLGSGVNFSADPDVAATRAPHRARHGG